jgi:hypothetical protein
VDEEFLRQSTNEELKRGKRKEELVWAKSGGGANHYGDCNTQALGMGYNLDFFQRGRTAEEAAQERPRARPDDGPAGGGSGYDPAMG